MYLYYDWESKIICKVIEWKEGRPRNNVDIKAWDLSHIIIVYYYSYHLSHPMEEPLVQLGVEILETFKCVIIYK